MPTMLWFATSYTEERKQRSTSSNHKTWRMWVLLCLLLWLGNVQADASARVKLDPFTVVLRPVGVSSLTEAETLTVRYEVERILADYLEVAQYIWQFGTSVTFVGVARLLGQTSTPLPNSPNQWELGLTMDGLVYFADGSDIPDKATMSFLVESALTPSALLAALQPLVPSISFVALEPYSTPAPTLAPVTPRPTPLPTPPPTLRPTPPPSPQPTPKQTLPPTMRPTAQPTSSPTKLPTARPTSSPTKLPTNAPVAFQTAINTVAPIAGGTFLEPTEASIPQESSSSLVEATVATDLGVTDSLFDDDSAMTVVYGAIAGGLVFLLAISMLIVRQRRGPHSRYLGTKPSENKEGGQASLLSGVSPTKTVESSNNGDSTGDEESSSQDSDRATAQGDLTSKTSGGSLASDSTIKTQTKTSPPSPSRFWYPSGNQLQRVQQESEPPQVQTASSSSVAGGSSTISLGTLEDLNSSWDTTSMTTASAANGLRSVESFEYKRHLNHTHVIKKDMLEAPGLSTTTKRTSKSTGGPLPQYYHPSMLIPVSDYRGALTPTDTSAATLAKEFHNEGAAPGKDADGADIDNNLYFGGAAAQLASFMTPISTWWGTDAEEGAEEGESPRDTDSTVSMPISLASSVSTKRLPMKLKPSTSFPASTKRKQPKQQSAESDDESLDFQEDWDPDDSSHSDESELGLTPTKSGNKKNGSSAQRRRLKATPASPVAEEKKEPHPSPSYRFFEAKVTNKDEQFLLSHSLRNESYKMQRNRNSFSSNGGSNSRTNNSRRVNDTGNVLTMTSATESPSSPKTSATTSGERPSSPLPHSIRRHLSEDDYV